MNMFKLFRRKPVIELRHSLALLRGRPSMFSPDINVMQEYQKCLFFVANEWMKDRRQNFVLDELGAVRRGVAFSMPKFNYRSFTGMGFDPQNVQVPLVDLDGYRIMGEIVEINPNSAVDPIRKLDKLMLNTVQFERQRIRLIVPYRDPPIVFENTIEERRPIKNDYGVGIDWLSGKFPHGHPLAGKKYWLGPEKLAYIWAWMYVGIPEYWKRWRNSPFAFNAIPTFKPKKTKKWLTRYYKYQNPTD